MVEIVILALHDWCYLIFRGKYEQLKNCFN